MSSSKTVAISIGLCGMALIVRLAIAALQLLKQKATGIGFVWRGMVEFVIASIVLGWLVGTGWSLRK